jgi:predicted dehydrogenase
MRKYNWAILGCGKIAKKFSSDLKLLPAARLYAAASRDFQRAQDLHQKWISKKPMAAMKRWSMIPRLM